MGDRRRLSKKLVLAMLAGGLAGYLLAYLLPEPWVFVILGVGIIFALLWLWKSQRDLAKIRAELEAWIENPR